MNGEHTPKMIKVASSKSTGIGENTSPFGLNYEREWTNGKINGSERIITILENSRYDGEWFRDKKHGSGKYKWSDGKTYKG